MKTKSELRKWLPNTPGSIIITVIGFFILLMGVWIMPAYFSSFTPTCGAYSNEPTMPAKPGLGIVQIFLIIATLLVIRGLTKFTHWWYKLVAVIILAIIFIIQFFMATSFVYFCF